MTKLWVIISFFLADLAVVSAYTNFTVDCVRLIDTTKVRVIQGEALHLPCPNLECSNEENYSLINWFKNGSDGIQQITTEESSRVHHHGPDLYILPLSLNDTGFYITHWWWMDLNETVCYELKTHIVVYEEFHTDQLYLHSPEEPGTVMIFCPVCEKQQKKWFTWYKDFRLIPGNTGQMLYVYNASKKDDGIYTCLCNWEHHGQIYRTSGSKQVQINEPEISFPPTILHPDNNSIQLIDLGSEVVLKCSVFFGINMRRQCFVFWERNRTHLDGVKGYIMHNRTENGTFDSYLTIRKVSQVDLQSEFHCIAQNLNTWVYVSITLKPRETLLPVVVMFLCILLIFLLAICAVKWFAIDMALFFRGLWITQRLYKKEDGKEYDAYVIYQKDVDDKTEKILAHFVYSILPAVLEYSCGYKLYIPGRDDLPGEDCMELSVKKMQLSRRLIVVLTSGTSREVTSSQGYDWKMGLYQVLVQQEMSIILIQLGEMKDYSHLPPGLQHLLQKSPPLIWKERRGQASSPSSRFWKKVRYMMPYVQFWSPEPASPKLHFQGIF